MIPYFEQPTFNLGSYTLHMFPILVCVAVVVGFELVVRRAPKVGLDPGFASNVVMWTIFWGFVGSHLFDVLAYFPERARRDPLELLKVWGSMSSFGGIFGGMLGAWAVMRRRGTSSGDMLRFVDCVAYAFPFAWIFGRAGCALAHDHLGILSDHWLAVRFPDGARLDLGLLELLYTFVIVAVFAALGRRPRPPGLFLGLFFVLYGPVRFVLDTLRIDDARYLGWTPGQYLSLLAAVAGTWVLVAVLRARPQAAV